MNRRTPSRNQSRSPSAQCFFCGENTSRENFDCKECYTMTVGKKMPSLDFIQLAIRIGLLSTDPLKALSIPRPSTHPLCSNDICKAANNSFRSFLGKQKQKKIHGNIDSVELYERIISEPCFYCGTNPANGIDRVSNTKGYCYPANVVPSCSLCNYVKGRYDLQTFCNKMNMISDRWAPILYY